MITQYQILHTEGNQLQDYGTRFAILIDEVRNCYPTPDYLILPMDELPADFSVDTHTIIDGALVPASDEVIAARAAAKIAEQNAAIREKRRQLYDDPNGECAPLYWDWVEAQSPEAFAAWVAAKNRVREQNPYVDANN